MYGTTNTTNYLLLFFFFIKLCNCKIFKKKVSIICMIYSFNFGIDDCT